ncbi:MAG: AAA family ATPase [Lachnospiraceae bacterium]|nr:AAA family ATPase [Lachnospiraceae bacterium]
MNIKKAKEQIENAMRAYFSKNEFGEYKIPIARQRPIFLMGPPGIGKTAIMEQIAAELGVGLISYSMTHHTRQSALGLPFIEKKNYGGREYHVSEYTMSEIIASVYDMMEETGIREGILFLDEINCVSETLEPSMLQFLQYKIFGRHRVPDGWIVVTAGNPPEYNNSVHEFDIVTWDRLKRIDVDPDYDAWKEYAYRAGTHAAVLTYLDIKKSDFYKIETTVDGKTFVTARGWSDLSDMIRLYEEHDLPVDEDLVVQYLQDRKIAKEFAVYYDLFRKYRSDYQVSRILEGQDVRLIRERASSAGFDERLSLLGLMLDAIGEDLKAVCNTELALTELMKSLRNAKTALTGENTEATENADESGHAYARRILEEEAAAKMEELHIGRRAGSISLDQQYALNASAAALREESEMMLRERPADDAAAFALLKKDFDRRTTELKEKAREAGRRLSNVFRFCEEVFDEGQEILILVTELTINEYSARFISRYGCQEYFAHNKELLFYERQKEIIREMETLELDGNL